MTDKEILLAVITGVTANPEYAQFSDETIANKAINISNLLTEKINENSCDKPRRHGKVVERDRRVSEQRIGRKSKSEQVPDKRRHREDTILPKNV